MVRRKFPSSSATRLVLYHSDFATVKITVSPGRQDQCRSPRKYFCCIKFSTQVLITLWKSPVHERLTSHPSTLSSCLHRLSATLFFHIHIPVLGKIPNDKQEIIR